MAALSRGVSGVKTQTNNATFVLVFSVPLPQNSVVVIELCTAGAGVVNTLGSDCKKIAFKRDGGDVITTTPCYDVTNIIGGGGGVAIAYNALTQAVEYSLSSTPAGEQIDWETMYSVVGREQ